MDAGVGTSPEGARPDPHLEAGVTEAVAEAYALHYAGLVRLVMSRTRDPELAADIAQEAFLRLLREAATGRFPDRPMAWLRQVALNLVTSRGRHAQVAARWEPWLQAALATQESPEGAVLADERDSQVRQAMAGLQHDERAALVLAAHGYAGSDIARAIGRSEGATRTLICRARSRLRGDLLSAVGA